MGDKIRHCFSIYFFFQINPSHLEIIATSIYPPIFSKLELILLFNEVIGINDSAIFTNSSLGKAHQNLK